MYIYVPRTSSSWPYIQVVYELLLRFVLSDAVDMADSRHFLSRSFLTQLLQRFHSQDPREREYIKTILVRERNTPSTGATLLQ